MTAAPAVAADAPTGAGERLILLDALRGVALAGVLLANLRDFSLYGLLDETARSALPSAGFDAWADAALDVLVGGKAMTLFALLFGMGFALQLQRAGNDVQARARFARRMLILFGFGLLHAWLLWWGDILRYYALLGLLLIPLARWRSRSLLLLGLFVTLLLTSLVQPLMGGWSARFGDGDALRTDTLAAFWHGGWGTWLRANFAYDLYLHVTAWSLVFFTLGRLLLGAGLGSGRWLLEPARYRMQWTRLLWTCLPAGLALTLAYALQDRELIARWTFGLEPMPARMLSRFLRNAAYLLTALGYLAGFVLAWLQPRGQRALAWFAPMGRMALTHYIAQSMAGIALFYGVGLGLGPRFGMPAVLGAFVLVFALQAWLGRWWLSHYRFGPLEWLWRSLTYARRQPLRLAAA
jgi:uncharacterized protein